MELYKLTAHELHDKLVNKEVSSVELTNALYARIDEVEDKVNAYVTLDKENANEHLLTLVGATPQTIIVRIWFEGMDDACNKDNLSDFLKQFNINELSKNIG